MKIFKFPGARMLDPDLISTAKNRNGQKDQGSKSPKTSTLKKSGSFDLTYYTAKKNKQLQRVYRAMSCDKKVRNKSSNSSKSASQLKTNIKQKIRPYKNHIPKKDLFFPSKKIFLQTDKKSKQLFNELKLNLDVFCERLERCLDIKSQKTFLQQYSQTIKIYISANSKQNNDESLSSFLQKVCKCQDRKFQYKIQQEKQKISILERQKSNLNVQLRRIKIKQEALNNDLKKLNDKNLQLVRQIKKLKEKQVISEFTQTDKLQKQAINIQDSEIGREFPKLIQQLRVLQQKQKHVNVLVGQLQRDGLNLQKIYKKGLKFTKNAQKAQQSQQQDSQDSQATSQQYEKYIQNQNKKQNPSSHLKKPKIKNKHDSDADDSIIDEIDALSFIYENKEDQISVFTPKRVYVCKKQMDENMKKQLALNFQCLYEEVEEQGSRESLPTI